jgi:hypothetical protein
MPLPLPRAPALNADAQRRYATRARMARAHTFEHAAERRAGATRILILAAAFAIGRHAIC